MATPSGTGDLLRLLADDTRLRVLLLLEAEPLTVAELQELLDLGQSSISGHLAKLKGAGLIHDLAEGSSRRYRWREDLAAPHRACWEAVRAAAAAEPAHAADRRRLAEVRDRRAASWVDRVAGSLHREYAPGRTWEALCQALLHFARFGRCLDIGAGDGAMIELLAPRSETLTCLDPSEAMVRAGEARAKALKAGNVRWLQAPGERLPLPDAGCDSVLFLQSLQYVAEPAKALAEAVRVLAPGGRLLVLTLAAHDVAECERYGHRHHGFSADQLKGWCRGLIDLRCETLAPEARPPRFQPIVLTAQKRPSP